MNLIKGLVDKRVDENNTALQAVLHLGQYAVCSSTTGMWYDDEYMEFLALLNMLYRSSVLNILWGPAHFGTVISRECDQSHFNPSFSKCNFPDVKATPRKSIQESLILHLIHVRNCPIYMGNNSIFHLMECS